MLKNEGNRLTRVIVCTPRHEYALGKNDSAHNLGDLGNPQEAIAQHDLLKSALKKFGSEVIDLPELDGHPNSVFTRDTAVMTPEGFIQLRLGINSRLGEGDWMSETLSNLGLPLAGHISSPGTVDGGDVVLAGNVAFVGQSTRTNIEGIRQLSAILEPMGYEMRVIPLPNNILHLDKVLLTIAPDTLLYCPNYVPKEMVSGFQTVEIECGGNTTANMICLGDNEVLVNQSNKDVIEKLQERGMTVHVLDLEEFAKGMGGPNCLIMPVERV